ncbi:ankyrin repeat domain-containing protein NDAI_0C00360 [Naumovozyma dairenensis CBS 421]|uniref:Uncharacterized protein n=1 Tax=Naumovozyma dairenensis (strain ATCC 10597 / BCRC 20456 / CBS 421 / NBRC 0211 / NRRL Y-12639) TaxID=1071378 RepID=G0W7D6_NAUDC|nr:hypothetical protein NDAI_0C00360 [Naumovozyma dairenensis CBS 421]CCD23697.1 hypothetical protein NDAI_0C00360 [Naumovozyma dairenensis CBS 421]
MMQIEPSERLREAIITGRLLSVKRLLRRYPELLYNIDPQNGWTSLHYAAFNGRYLVCVYLIQLGHDKNETLRTFQGNTCVHLALKNGHEQTTHLLLQHFSRFLNDKGEGNLAPIHIACINDYHQCLSMLISLGADLSIVDENGDNSLNLCLQYGSLDCLKLLLMDDHFHNEMLNKDKNKNHWKPDDIVGSYETQKIYQQLLKENLEAKQARLPRNNSFQSLRSPIVKSVQAFTDNNKGIINEKQPKLTISTNERTSYHNDMSDTRSLMSPKLDIPIFTPTQRFLPRVESPLSMSPSSISTESQSLSNNEIVSYSINDVDSITESNIINNSNQDCGNNVGSINDVTHTRTETINHHNIESINRYLLVDVPNSIQEEREEEEEEEQLVLGNQERRSSIIPNSYISSTNNNSSGIDPSVNRSKASTKLSLLSIPISKVRR